MGGKSKKPTVGYKYYLGVHMAFAHGPLDNVSRIEVDRRIAWEGDNTGGQIDVDAEELFGGDGREGGVSGLVDVEMGYSNQIQNNYLQSLLGDDIPAFRGVACLVLRQCYMGNNPYLKPWAIRAQRIHVTSDGSTQWYDEKAEIASSESVIAYNAAIEWSQGAGVGDWTITSSASEPSLNTSLGTDWDGTDPYPYQVGGGISIGTEAQLYGTFDLPIEALSALIRINVYHDDGPSNFRFNGVAQTLTEVNYFYSYVDVEVSALDTLNEIYYEVTQGVPGGTTTDFGMGINIEILDPRDNLDEALGPCADMNPAHIIRECLTDANWGMGYTSSDMDDVAFMAAADTLFDENMGISLTWSREASIEDFIAEILRHIDGVLYVDRTTGKFVLKLVRPDYSVSDLITLNESNVSEISSAQRPTIGDLIATVTVRFWDKATGEAATVTRHNQALQQLQTGGGGSTPIEYPGFTSYSLANRVVDRDLKALSTPLLSCSISASREAESLNVGDAFILDWPDLEINNLIMRVQQMSFGDGRDNTVKIDAIEDSFVTEPLGSSVDQPDDIWIDPLNQLPEAADPRLVTEAPYWEVVQQIGDLQAIEVFGDDPDAGFLLVAAGRQNNEVNASLYVDSGAGYNQQGTLDFSPYAYLTEDVDYTDTQIYIEVGNDLDLVEVGTVAQIGDELIRIDAIDEDSNGQYITAGRGILDTTPRPHPYDSGNVTPVIFWGEYAATDETQYVDSDAVDVKLRTLRGATLLSLASAPANSMTMNARGIRPYPPGNLRISGFSYPAPPTVLYTGINIIDWTHRDRLLQTDANLYDYTAASIGPEAGTTYRVEAEGYNAFGTSTGIFVNESVAAVTTYQFDGVATPAATTASVAVRVFSVRGGYESWQPAEVFIDYVPDSGEDDDVKVLIEEIENTTAGEFDFDTISGDYKRLIIEGYVRGDVSEVLDSVHAFFNADTTESNYHRQHSYTGDGSASVSEAAEARVALCPAATATADSYGTVRIVLEDYAGARLKTAFTSFVMTQAADDITTGNIGGYWDSTAAITRVRIRADGHPTDGLLGKLSLYGEL